MLHFRRRHWHLSDQLQRFSHPKVSDPQNTKAETQKRRLNRRHLILRDVLHMLRLPGPTVGVYFLSVMGRQYRRVLNGKFFQERQPRSANSNESGSRLVLVVCWWAGCTGARLCCHFQHRQCERARSHKLGRSLPEGPQKVTSESPSHSSAWASPGRPAHMQRQQKAPAPQATLEASGSACRQTGTVRPKTLWLLWTCGASACSCWSSWPKSSQLVNPCREGGKAEASLLA